MMAFIFLFFINKDNDTQISYSRLIRNVHWYCPAFSEAQLQQKQKRNQYLDILNSIWE